jgi:hypothetical protein
VNWSGDPYGGGFHFWNTHVRSWEVIPRIRRPAVMQAWTKLKDGYDTLPKEMVRRFEKLGGEVRTGTRLLGLEPQGRGANAVLGIRLQAQGTVETLLARNVILAMPQRSVRLLIEDTFLAQQQQFVDDLGTVTCEPASKLFLTFAEPWWRKVPTPPGQTEATIQRGQSATDLPMRLCYYLGSEENGRSLLLASFTDSIGIGNHLGRGIEQQWARARAPVGQPAAALWKVAVPIFDVVQEQHQRVGRRSSR